MNRPERDMTADDDRRFDLLVDGELSPADRRTLLLRLDDEPGAWRRCALAFLEAQAWREDFAVSRREPAATKSATAGPQPRRPGRLLRAGGTLAAMAASFLAAMALAWWLDRPGGSSDVLPRGPIQVAEEVTPSAPVVGPSPQVAERGLMLPQKAAAVPDAGSGRWRWVTLAPEQGLPEGARPLRLPAVETDSVDDTWLRELPSGVPPEVLDALRQAGHRVRQHRQLVPFPLEDGRSLLVPVDEVDVHYVGNELYR